ncbi:MAG: calcium/sodium antiporter [Kiritimatiellales bacterium]|nr:calcium/sodium antiporter [Pontiella sp.]NNJ71363.1 calcium/sodium antiporter [Kiritimatiellales bacterium]
METLQLISGLLMLLLGAEALVRGASKLAAAIGISPLVIGLTVVAFGTSAPEMAVSTAASLAGQSDIATGNVIGSNIFNILLILGLSAVVTPLAVAQRLIRLDVPLMIAVSVLVYLFSLNGTISRMEGWVLLSGIVIYTAVAIRQSRRESHEIKEEYAREYAAREPFAPKCLLMDSALILAGLGLLLLGSKWLVTGATAIAQRLGVSDLVIGLTIVAAGTSLPELATSVVASIRGEREIAVGNVVGSNLFNLLAVLGLAGMVSSAGIAVTPQALRIDLPVMLLASIICLPFFFTGGRISRREGILFLIGYIAYTAWLVLSAVHG